MSRRTRINLGVLSILLIAICGLIAATIYYTQLPKRLSQHETIVMGQNRFVPGSAAALRVLVRDSKDASPLENAQINVSLKPADGGRAVTVFSGKTGAGGTVDVMFHVPSDALPNQTLVIETRSRLGSDRVERQVTISRDYRILLTSDKPIYQPGQVIHLRALALSTFDLTPAKNQALEVTIADGKGNKVFRKSQNTTDYGVAVADFQLANEVNTGPYKIAATLGNTSSETTVTVEHYVLPKFSADLKTERSYYLPGGHVAGTLSANYFFGKPVAGGNVLLEGYTFDVQRNVTFSLQGVTDAQGNYAFEFDLPPYIAGSDLEGGLGRFYLQATVTDLAKHTEISNISLPVSGSSLVIKAVPEGGQPLPGVENILYVLTSYPDGSPAKTDLTVYFPNIGQQQTIRTGDYGLAELRYTPQNAWEPVNIQANDAQGHVANQQFNFQGQYSEETVLLRPEKPLYRVGEAMKLTVLTSKPKGAVYLDIVRDGQTVSTRSIDMEDGRAELVIDLTPDLYGTLELHAYKILTSGSITRDTRLVVVDRANDLSVSLSPQQDTYRPGDTANLNIQVFGKDGKGAQSALGLAIVDESVFALAEQDPGFAKLYFLLESELMVPKIELHGFSIPDLVNKGPQTDNPAAQGTAVGAAQASLASSVQDDLISGRMPFSLQANSHTDAMQRAYDLQKTYFTGLSKVTYPFILLLPIGMVCLSGYSLWKQRTLGRSLLLTATLLGWLAVIVLVWPLGQDSSWVRTPLDRLGMLFQWIGYRGLWLAGGMALLALVSYLGLWIIAGVRGDGPLAWINGLLILFTGLLFLATYAAFHTNPDINEKTALAGLVAAGAVPLTYLLLSAGFAWQKRLLPALASLAVSAFLLVGAVPLLGIAAMSRGAAMAPAAPVMGVPQAEGLLVEKAQVAATMMPAPTQTPEAADMANTAAQASTGQPPRLRQYFPETMLWTPDAITNPDGSLNLPIPVADSITTWRITALASTQDGRLGSATAPLRVFQDFFIDLDLPLSLTVGDEVSVPVGVFNYLPNEQTVRLEVEKADWFELLDEPVKEMTIGANDISVVYFRVKAVQFGQQPFKVTASGSSQSDAILKQVQVYPNGKQIPFTHSDWLNPGKTVDQSFDIPADAIPGTQRLVVKVYPGMISQVVEGLDSILRMPFGCFEQTSSITYPNLLVMDYLKTSGKISPEIQMKAEEYINLGYQRLTTFEVGSTGGFSLFGEAPADRMLTAYGLQEFADMRRVHDVDPALIERAARWLLSQQDSDGSWANDRGLVHETTWSNLGNDRLPVTAYIAWSLIQAGYGNEAGTQKGLQYVKEFQSKADDPYVLALAANALVAVDQQSGGKISESTATVLDRLAGLAQRNGDQVFWQSKVATFMGSTGQTGSIETTALATLALIRGDRHPDLVNGAISFIIQQKDNSGTWYNTQATVLSLKVLIENMRAGAEKVNANVTVTLNGGQTRKVQVTPENFDVVQLLTFDDINIGSPNQVRIDASGEGKLMYQISGSYYLPWEKLASYPNLVPEKEKVTIDVKYDRTELSVNDTVTVSVTVNLNEPGGRADSGLIDLGIPPGFTVLTEDLDALVAHFKDVPPDYSFATVQRYELTGRQVLVYIANLSEGKPLQFTYRLQAKYPLSVKSPASNAYDYYNPDISGESAPQALVVNP